MKTSKILLFALFLHFSVFAQNSSKNLDEAQGLPVGAQIENFEAYTANGELINLHEELKKGPAVIIFYRGAWCPICNKHLSEIQDNLDKIKAKGAQVFAISPQKPELANKTAHKTNAEFVLVFDEAYKISNQFDVTFNPDEKSKKMYNNMLRANLKEAHSDDSEQLPIPATYIISQEGVVVWRQFDPNYKNRSSAADILANIP